jgi:hypothetical protein
VGPFSFFVVVSFTVLIYSQISLAAGTCDPSDRSQCCVFVQSQNQLSISRILTYDQGACTLSVYNQQSATRFRRMGFGSDGQVSVFMQVEGNSRSNATQSFLIYPFGENPTLNMRSGGSQLEIATGSGQKWTFNSQNKLPTSVDSCTITASPSFSTSNSGINLTDCENHLVVTTPVEVGGEYISYPNKPLTLHDPKGKTCAITTSDLYNYIDKGPNNTKDRVGRYYNIKLKFKTNAAMARALASKCPNIDVSVLVPPRPAFNLNLDDLLDPSDELEE